MENNCLSDRWSVVDEILPLEGGVGVRNSVNFSGSTIFFLFVFKEKSLYPWRWGVEVHVACTCLSPDTRSLDRWVTAQLFFFSYIWFCPIMKINFLNPSIIRKMETRGARAAAIRGFNLILVYFM